MYRLAILVALLALLVAGCGGGGSDSADDGTDQPAVAVADASDSADKAENASADKPKAKKDAKKPAEDADKHDDDESEAEDDEHASTDPHEAIEEALEKASPKKRAQAIRGLVQSVLLRFNLKLADLEVANGGKKINVLVTRASACNAVAKDEPSMVVLIKEGAPIVRSATFEVAGTGQQLGYYVINCKREKMPSGPGRVVFKHTGVSGPYTSPKFEVKSKKWALEWENQGSSMACIVLAVAGESKGEYFKPIGEQKRGAGRNVYTGSGTFQLKIHGAALWSVRVKEIR